MTTIVGTGSIGLTSAITMSGTNAFGGPRFDSALALTMRATAGTGAGQADVVYQSELSLADGDTVDLNLADGSLLEPTAGPVAMAKLIAVVLAGMSVAGVDNTTEVVIGGGDTPVLGAESVKLRRGGRVVLWGADANGLAAVSSGSADTLRLVNGAGAAAKVQVLLIGRSA